jgi:hypothetical protein
VFKLFGAERFLAVTSQVALETNADQLGEMIGKFCPEMTWNQELDGIEKYAPASPVDEAITVVQKRFPNIKIARFLPSVKNVTITSVRGSGTITVDVPDKIIEHLTRECGGNVYDRHVVDVTSGSFEKQTRGANPRSGAYNNYPDCAAKNAADFETDSYFSSVYRTKEEDVTHTPNN